MKNLFSFIFILTFVLFGCGKDIDNANDAATSNFPSHILLSNDSGVAAGLATLVQDDIFVTMDHLGQEDFGNLYWRGIELKPMIRNFDKNILFFQIRGWGTDNYKWSNAQPVVGRDIFLAHNGIVGKETVLSVADKETEKAFGISNTFDLMYLGVPVFDEKNIIYGIVINTNESENTSLVLRSDMILRILEENSY